MFAKRRLLLVLVFLVLLSSVPWRPDTRADPLVPVSGPAHMRLPTALAADRPATAAESAAASAVLLSEDFEGSFPGGRWLLVGELSTPAYLWGRRNCRSHGGAYAAWAAGGRESGAVPGCGQNYPPEVRTWMVAGPFDLRRITQGQLTFWHWTRTESQVDKLYVMLSLDQTNFYGLSFSGDWASQCAANGGWCRETVDLTDVYTLGNVTGQPNVWIAFIFVADGSIEYEGTFVDDVSLVVGTGGEETPAPTSTQTAAPTQTAISTPTRTPAATGTPSPTSTPWVTRTPTRGGPTPTLEPPLPTDTPPPYPYSPYPGPPTPTSPPWPPYPAPPTATPHGPYPRHFLRLPLIMKESLPVSPTATRRPPSSPTPGPSPTPTFGYSECGTCTRVGEDQLVWVDLGHSTVQVRYLGIEVPKVSGGDCYGEQAYARNRALVLGRQVCLQRDFTNRDLHGHLYRYVFVDGVLINRQLVAEGYAYAHPLPFNTLHDAEIAAAQAEARAAQRGVWATCPTPTPRPAPPKGEQAH